jgi:hypothetical protein
MKMLVGAVATLALAASIAGGAKAQTVPVPAGMTPATAPPQLYVPLRDAFLAMLRADAPLAVQFDYAQALQRAQAGDILGAQQAAARALTAAPPLLPPSLARQVRSAIAMPLSPVAPNSTALPFASTIPSGPGHPQPRPPDDPLAALDFARSEIDLAELRVGHPLDDARRSYVDAEAALQRNDVATALTQARQAADAALEAYTKGP